MTWLTELPPYATFNILRGLSMGVCAPIWIAYLYRQGLSFLELGLLGALFEATKLLFEVPAGGLADTRGEQWALSKSTLTGALAYGLFLWTTDMVLAALLMVFWATSEAMVSGAYEAWVAKSVQAEEVTKTLMGCTRLFIGAAVVGGISGGLLYLAWTGLPFLLATLLMILNGIIVRQASFPPHRLRAGETSASVWSIMLASTQLIQAQRSVLRVIVAGFFVSLAYDAVARFWQLDLTTRGFSEVWFGGVFASAGLVGLLLLSAGIRWHRLIHRQPFLALAFLDILSIGFCLCLVAGGAPIALAAVSLLLAMEDVREPIVHSLLANRLDTEHKATLFSLYAGVGSAGEILSGVVFGVIAQSCGLAVTFLVVGLCLVPSVGLLLSRARGERQAHTAVPAIGEL
jgi:MFS family permease